MQLPKLKAPLVLVHGLFGFEQLQVGGVKVAGYFPGIFESLQKAGNRVLIPQLPPTDSVAERARRLKEFILRESPEEPVHILAHSMGGLDSRYMVSCLGMGDKVLTLTTLGTPHRGTAFADWAISSLERLVRPALNFLGVPIQGFYDLTTAKCREFNQAVPDVPSVRYFSVAGKHDGNVLNPEWLLPYFIVLQAEGPNDGVVSVASAEWGEKLDIWDGDHFSLVNWFHPWGQNRGIWRDPFPRFGPLLQRLANEGF